MSATSRKKRDPIFGAAVLKLTFQRRHDEQSPQFKAIYEGVIRDLGVTDAEVNAFLATHQSEVEEAIRAHGRGEIGDRPSADDADDSSDSDDELDEDED